MAKLIQIYYLVFVISLAQIVHDNANNVQFVVIIGILTLAVVYAPRSRSGRK